jgi:hypothetical protein
LVHYRLYFNDERGHIIRALSLECASDIDAISQSKAKAKGWPFELWERSRKVYIGVPLRSAS